VWAIAASAGRVDKKEARLFEKAWLLGQLQPTYTLVRVRTQFVQSRLEMALLPSITFTFCTFKFQERRVAFLDHGRVLPNCVPRPHCSHFAITHYPPQSMASTHSSAKF
jgi:hypothetical protein